MKGKYTKSGYREFVFFLLSYKAWGFTDEDIFKLTDKYLPKTRTVKPLILTHKRLHKLIKRNREG